MGMSSFGFTKRAGALLDTALSSWMRVCFGAGIEDEGGIAGSVL